jgi:hypothetical protein
MTGRVLAIGVALAIAPAGVAHAAVDKPAAIRAVKGILAREQRACDMTWGRVSARLVGAAWRVSAHVVTSGNPGTAAWWVQVRTSRITPAEPLAAEISHGCP